MNNFTYISAEDSGLVFYCNYKGQQVEKRRVKKKRAHVKIAEWMKAEQKRVKKQPNQNKTPVFLGLDPPLLSSAHADIKLPLSCLWSEGGWIV